MSQKCDFMLQKQLNVFGAEKDEGQISKSFAKILIRNFSEKDEM